MLKLSIDEIVEKIQKEEIFTAITEDSAFLVSISEYVPYVCSAIHNGGNFREELKDKIAVEKMERWKEEDTHTWKFVASLPIRIVVYDSRYEYDLNRNPNEAIYNEAWGKKVWKKPLSDNEKAISLQKHANFYKVIDALVSKLEEKFDNTLFYDIHSYNYKRTKEDKYPEFNLGTEKITNPKFRKYINKFLKELAKIDLQPLENRVAENNVFYGRGYLLEYITAKYQNTLVLATEVKKIYVDELTGNEYPEITEKIAEGLKKAILNTSYYYVKNTSTSKLVSKYQLLSSLTEDTLTLVDHQYFEIVKRLDVLHYINPTNISTEKKAFFKSKYKKAPKFKYKPIPFNLSNIKRELYALPVDKIKDVTFRKLYHDLIEHNTNKAELLSLREQESFLYTSLRHFGKPTKEELENAKYILYLADIENQEKIFSASETKSLVEEFTKQFDFKCNVKLSKQISAKAMVQSSSKSVLIRDDATFKENFAHALCHHEVGIHMLTTMNSHRQPLKFLRVGLPKNTATQEGLAVLSELRAGYFSIERLKELAIRVIAVDMVVKGFDFIEIFEALKDIYKLDDDVAFQVATRVSRGGGFTKDYLYLKGFKKVYDTFVSGKDLDILMIGKTSIEYKAILNELVKRGILNPAHYLPPSFMNTNPIDPLITYLLKGLK